MRANSRLLAKTMTSTMARAMTGAILLGLASISSVQAADKPADKPAFSRMTIDVGVVVSDIGRSVKFYTEAVGFQESPGFAVPGDFAGDAGLTYNKPLDVHVLTLGEGEGATKLKLMEIKGADSKKNDNEYIHSQLGFRYITIFVTDTNAALARLKKAGVKPIAKQPQPLPKGLPEGVFLTVVRDPDGNMVELVGPKETKTRKSRSKAEKEKSDK